MVKALTWVPHPPPRAVHPFYIVLSDLTLLNVNCLSGAPHFAHNLHQEPRHLTWIFLDSSPGRRDLKIRHYNTLYPYAFLHTIILHVLLKDL